MILTKNDYYDLEKFFLEYKSNEYYYMDIDPINYFGEKPYLLFPSHFCECRKLLFDEYLWNIEYDWEKDDDNTIFEETKTYKKIKKAIIDSVQPCSQLSFQEAIKIPH